MRRRRIVAVKHRVVFGTKAAMDQVLAACGWHINTSFVERLNLSLCQRAAAGLTDHVWSLREVMMFRVPPWPQTQTV